MTTPTSARSSTWRCRANGTLAAVLAACLLAPPSAAFAADDPNLDQTIQESQATVHGDRTLTAGHVDMGPRFVDGAWTFLIHDDVAKTDANATSVWRYPAETVFHVLDAARLPVPDDPAYQFLGAPAGQDVYVVPQTQHPDVVWVGWNTQDPEVMSTIDRGITLSLNGVQGPGTMTTYLQSGSFGEAQLLWDSRTSDPQPIWVDVNTHTHANWVFTEPGVYLVEATAEADLVDGSHVSDTQQIRFAVGTSTSPQDALAATWEGARTTTDGAAAPDGQPAGTGVLVPVLVGVGVLLMLALVVRTTVTVVRNNRAKRRILAAYSTVDLVDGGAEAGDRL